MMWDPGMGPRKPCQQCREASKAQRRLGLLPGSLRPRPQPQAGATRWMEKAAIGDPPRLCVTMVVNAGNKRLEGAGHSSGEHFSFREAAPCLVLPFSFPLPAQRSMTKTGIQGPESGLDFRPSGDRWEEVRPRPGVGPLVGCWTGRQLLPRAAPSNTRMAGACANVCKMSPRHTNEFRATEFSVPQKRNTDLGEAHMGAFSLWSHTGGNTGKAFGKVLCEAQGIPLPRVLGSLTSLINFPVRKQGWPPEHEDPLSRHLVGC